MLYRAGKVLGTIALLVVAAVFISQAFPGVVGADHTYVVKSGSMEPAIQTGSVVYVKSVPAEDIQEGDVITFADSRTGPPTTHRVIDKRGSGDSLRFITKGDANEEADVEPVYPDQIIGVVMFSIPYLGYAVEFMSTKLGWFLFVVIPVLLLIGTEIWELYRAMDTEDTKT